MHPELSLVFLTVLGGIGQGIFIVLFIFKYLFLIELNTTLVFFMLGISLTLQVIGTSASLLHLAHPFRVWKAILMFRSSWLSREVITGGIAFAFTALYALSYFLDLLSSIQTLSAYLAFIGAIAFLISSSMLYASIKYIKEWSSPLTPFMFFLTGLTGATALVYTVLWAIHPLSSELINKVSNTLITLTTISLLLKLYIYRIINKVYVPFNLNTALSVKGSSTIIQMDMGTPYEHFNTKEFSYPITKEKLKTAKSMVITLGFIIPLALWTALSAISLLPNLSFIISLLGSLSMIIGFILERRLFFIQGNHVQNLYYNRFSISKAQNPLLSKARKGTPTP